MENMFMERNLDAILTLKEVAQALRLDPRTVKEGALEGFPQVAPLFLADPVLYGRTQK